MATLHQETSAIDSIASLLEKISDDQSLKIAHYCQYSNGNDCTFYKIQFEGANELKVGYIFYNVSTCKVYRARYKKMAVAIPTDVFDLLLDIYNYEKRRR